MILSGYRIVPPDARTVLGPGRVVTANPNPKRREAIQVLTLFKTLIQECTPPMIPVPMPTPAWWKSPWERVRTWLFGPRMPRFIHQSVPESRLYHELGKKLAVFVRRLDGGVPIARLSDFVERPGKTIRVMGQRFIMLSPEAVKKEREARQWNYARMIKGFADTFLRGKPDPFCRHYDLYPLPEALLDGLRELDVRPQTVQYWMSMVLIIHSLILYLEKEEAGL